MTWVRAFFSVMGRLWAGDVVPPIARPFLLGLLVCLHVAGAMVLSRLSNAQDATVSPAVLQASWVSSIADAAAPPALASVSAPTQTQVREKQKKVRQPRIQQPRQRVVPLLAAHRPASRPLESVVVPEPPSEPESPATPSADVATVEAMVSPGAANEGGGGKAEGTAKGVANGAAGGEEGGEDCGKPDFHAAYLSNPHPEYPPLSRRMREEGAVTLRVHVKANGQADEVHLKKSSGYSRLDNTAIETVWRWRFSPRCGAIPVAGWVIVPFLFELQG